jgi:hypothetical protein
MTMITVLQYIRNKNMNSREKCATTLSTDGKGEREREIGTQREE